MKTVVILGAGQFGLTAAGLLNADRMKLIAYGDNNPGVWNTTADGGWLDVPVMSVPQAVAMKPDCILIGVTDEQRAGQLKEQAEGCGFRGEYLLLGEMYRHFDVRSATLKQLASRLAQQGVAGSLAELGVYKGDTAWKLNALFPDRKLFLFDTFEGFDSRDIRLEAEQGCSRAMEGDFSDTNVERVLERLPFPQNAIVRKGYFPETARGLEAERFALVSLDADLYAPLLAGLAFFYPRLSPGGMILLHDYNNRRFRGAHKAVEDYERECGEMCLVPLCDLHQSAVIGARPHSPHTCAL